MGSRLDGAQLVDNPYPFYARLRDEAPVWQVPGTNAFLVSTWDLVTEATARVPDFSNNFRHAFLSEDDGSVGVFEVGGGPDVFAGADPPAHTQHRKLFFSELVQKKMDGLTGDVETLADRLLDDMLASPRADAAAQLANPLPIRIMAERVIGFRVDDIAQTQRWVFAGSRMMGGRIRRDEMGDVAMEAGGMAPWVTEQLDDALASPAAGDVLNAAATGVHNGILTRDEAAFTLMVLLGAGGETTTSLIGNAIRLLAERPELQLELRTNPDRIPAFVEEVLRFESPFRFHQKSTPHPVQLGGVDIPAESMVVLMWGAANRDASVFEDPDEIIIGRENARMHLGFGRGVHHCVGAPLARIEARVVLERLLARTEHFVLDPGAPPRWMDNIWVRRHERVPLVVEPA